MRSPSLSGSTSLVRPTGLLKIITAAALAGIVSGCDAVIDCVDNDGPDFTTRTLPAATLNQEYQETISASVQNEPFDSRFEYDFTIVSGALPAGISTSQSGQLFILNGTPTELGTYTIELNVFVDDGESALDSGLCFRNRARTFNLVVEQDSS